MLFRHGKKGKKRNKNHTYRCPKDFGRRRHVWERSNRSLNYQNSLTSTAIVRGLCFRSKGTFVIESFSYFARLTSLVCRKNTNQETSESEMPLFSARRGARFCNQWYSVVSLFDGCLRQVPLADPGHAFFADGFAL